MWQEKKSMSDGISWITRVDWETSLWSFDHLQSFRAIDLHQLIHFQEPIPFKLDFMINKKGEIENIKTDIEKQEIANEIIKLVNKLPKFKQPGTINGLPTNMPFSLQMTLNFF